jgi:hypothetical protein
MQFNRIRQAFFACCAIGFLVFSTSSYAVFISLDPRATYLLNTADPLGQTALNATAYSLADLGFIAGETVLIQRVGDYKAGVGTSGTTGLPFQDNQLSLLAVFSSSSTLLGPLTSDRLPGALMSDAPGIVTLSTAWGEPYYTASLATDIPDDFSVNNGGAGQIVTIPVGALYIFFSPNDNNFADNSDTDGDYGVSITAVPEPASLALLGLGVAMLVTTRTRKSRR